MENYKAIAEAEFQKLPLEEREKLVSVSQTWNKAFECGALFVEKNKSVQKSCMNCGNNSCRNNKKRESQGCGRWLAS